MDSFDKFFSLPSKFYTDFVQSGLVAQLGLLLTVGPIIIAVLSLFLRQFRLKETEKTDLQQLNETRYKRIQKQEEIIKNLENQLTALESQFIEARIEQSQIARNEGKESIAIQTIKSGYDDVASSFAECCSQLAKYHIDLSAFEKGHSTEAERLARIVLLLLPEHRRAKGILAEVETLKGDESRKKRDYEAYDNHWDNIDDYLGYVESLSDLSTVSKRGNQHFKNGEYRTAERIFRYAIKLSFQQDGPTDSKSLILRSNQALCIGYMGDAREALTLFKALLPDQEKVHGKEHPETLITRGDIAAWTGDTGDAPEALTLFKALLPDQEKVLGKEHPATLTTRNNIATWTGDTGDAPEALTLFKALLPDQEKVLGKEHPETLTTRNNLAVWTGNTGDGPEALTLFKALLPDQEKVLGKEHPATLSTRSNIAAWTGNTGDGPEALTLFKALLPDREKVLGKEHPASLSTRSNLAVWTGNTGDGHKALTLFKALLPDQEKVLGKEHPASLTTRSNIDFLLKKDE